MAATLAAGYAADNNFQQTWALNAISAHFAYAHVNLLKGPDAQPGAGITIGVVDSGIDTEHPAFSGKTVSETFAMGAIQEDGTEQSHGTAVASVAAGVPLPLDSNAPHGVAWGANLAVWAIPASSSSDGTYSPISAERLNAMDGGFADLFASVLGSTSAGETVDVANMSFGFNGLINQYSEEVLRTNFGGTIAALAQAGVTDKIILVWSAGNYNGVSCADGIAHCVNNHVDAVSPAVLAGLVARIEELQGHSIAVTALTSAGEIANFSNRCGIAADHCIAAPGHLVGFAYFGPYEGEAGFRAWAIGSGTSLSAPMVTGSLAVMKQLFREQLSSEELVARLFATADKTGIYADRSIYGQGRMDLGAATSPVGVLDVPITTGRATVMGHASLNATGLRLGAAFGDGVQTALADREIMSLDGLRAPFWHDLGGFAVTTDGPSMAARLRSFLAPTTASTHQPNPGLRAEVLRMPTATGSGHLALAEGAAMLSASSTDGVSASAFTTGSWRLAMPAAGAAFGWKPAVLPFGLRIGWVEEHQTLLGSMGHGAFGNLSASTGFVGLDGGVRVGRWRLGGSGEFGVALPEVHGGLIQDISALATSAFAVHLGTGFGDTSTLEFSLSQPLRVETGAASLSVPSARTPHSKVLYDALRAELAPADRQLDFTAQWSRRLPRGEFRVGAVWSHRAGHRDTLGPQLALLSGWRWTF